MDLNLSDFFLFCDREVGLSVLAERLVDAREAPRISTASIFEGLFLMGLCGWRSVLELDQKLRSPTVRAFLSGRSHRPFSDTTAHRVAGGMDVFRLADLSQRVVTALSEKGIGCLPLSTGRAFKVAILDGTKVGGQHLSCLARSGRMDVVLDALLQERFGKELPTSKALVRRAVDRFGKGFADLLLADALYFDHAFINQCTLEAGVDVLIKVARVTETHLKGKLQGQTFTFFALTTRSDLTALEMRDLAHHRWRIENNVFRALNDKMRTKHLFAHDPQAAYVIAHILFLAWNLLQAFLLTLSTETIRKTYRKAKVTLRSLRDLLAQSLWRTPVQNGTP